MLRIAIAVAAAAIGTVLAAAPASAATNCYTPHVGPYPTVEMCLDIPNPVQ